MPVNGRTQAHVMCMKQRANTFPFMRYSMVSSISIPSARRMHSYAKSPIHMKAYGRMLYDSLPHHHVSCYAPFASSKFRHIYRCDVINTEWTQTTIRMKTTERQKTLTTNERCTMTKCMEWRRQSFRRKNDWIAALSVGSNLTLRDTQVCSITCIYYAQDDMYYVSASAATERQ